MQEGQPISTAMLKAVANLGRESQQHSSEEKRKLDIQIQNHVAPRTKLYVPIDVFTILLDDIDVQRQTKTSIIVLHEGMIDDHWNMEGDKSLSEPWIGVTQFALPNKKTVGKMWVQGRLTKTQVTTRPENIWPKGWSSMSKNSRRKAINKWAEEKQIGRSGSNEAFT